MIELARLLLAAVFAVAGVAKLLDREGSRRAARAFGGPAWLGIALPVAELMIALALVPSSTARAAAIAGAGLLALFIVAITNALLRGRKPDCGCFGRLHSAPAGWGTVARNASLAALALAVASQPAGALSWVEGVVALVAIVVVAQAILAVTLLRRYGRALRTIEELEASATAPPETAAPATGTSPAPNGRARVATAGALAGGLAVTAAAAQAAPPTDPELKAIDDLLRAAGPRLVAASQRSRKAIRAADAEDGQGGAGKARGCSPRAGNRTPRSARSARPAKAATGNKYSNPQRKGDRRVEPYALRAIASEARADDRCRARARSPATEGVGEALPALS